LGALITAETKRRFREQDVERGGGGKGKTGSQVDGKESEGIGSRIRGGSSPGRIRCGGLLPGTPRKGEVAVTLGGAKLLSLFFMYIHPEVSKESAECSEEQIEANS